MKISGLILTAVLVVPLTAVGQKTTSPDVIGGNKPSQDSLQAEHFLTVLANEDQSEIDLAKLALKKSSNAQVKQYAQTKILDADPAMEQEAKKLSQQTHAPAGGDPNGAEKAEFYYLSKLTGKTFDAAYMSYEDAKQREDLIVVQNEAASEKNPQVKQFAQKEEKPVQQAADSAKTIAQSLMQ
jgi:putative membrane protein